MSFSLYEAIVPTMIQILQAGQGWIASAKSCGIAEEELAQTRLIEDMLPFSYQARSMITHSVGAIEGARKGSFSPDLEEAPTDLETMRLALGAAENTMRALSKGEVDSFIDGEMHFTFPAREIDIPFATEDFLLSFSQPNFFFHATTAYGILRMKGVKLGKTAFMGQLRTTLS
ncbi:hypothetical protein CP97_11635 [Aurantiacibacter atlanticus]|uniref:DUF1993 domain-containing protein n=1 Tax=Aurantiacibacter atlanticus TaxID=1648404 RepID=A0A0H4VZB0_9SPHN|nr:DUF1993 domain-containing protein [Aurantiacibacter atlanticus]AKQ42543.1 hypothetical protein CP97_11635 [Aurantiacibacter atlanticus]MDF1834061.1 DUF1993 domain-containing protein [Alteraurantiacibacter sp. bin_em_oilr2.035]